MSEQASPGGAREAAQPLTLHEYEFSAMGSACSLHLYAATAQHADVAAQRAIDEVLRIEARYSRYREDSELSRINRVAAEGGRVTLDDEAAALVEHAFACHARSGGLFDLTSGLLRRAWDFTRPVLPEQSSLDALLRRVGMSLLDWRAPTLTFLVPGMELDLGGLAKEHAADRAVECCRELGVTPALANLGGDVAVSGPRPDGSAWQVGLVDPRAPDRLLGQVALSRGGLATSGDYERCFEKDGQRYGHLLDPFTGWPVRGLASVSVVADRCLVAGSVSTIAMLMGDAGIPWLAGLGLPSYWVKEDGGRPEIRPPFSPS